MVYEDDTVVAVLDVLPCAEGHSLVFPRRHAQTILDLDAEYLGKVFGGVQRVTELLLRTLKPHGFTIGINHGKAGGQAIEHLHIHIIPRFEDDGGGSIHSVVHHPPTEQLERVFQKIVAKGQK